MTSTSTVKKWFDDKGYGFIQNPDGGNDDIFVHHSKVLGRGRKSLEAGQSVEFEKFRNEKDRWEARNVLVMS